MAQSIGNNDNDLSKNILRWGNRGWLEIIYTILGSCSKGALKTHIMYSCNLNSVQVKRYLRFLQSRNLIERLGEVTVKRPKYKTTQLGEKYTRIYNDLVRLLR